jgi:transposase
MLTIFWNPNGLHLIDAIPKREKYSTRCYVDNILIPICQRLIPADKYKLVIHADNSPCPTASVVLDFVSQRKVHLPRIPQYSPDIAPSDIFLFGDLKRDLRSSRFQTGEELLVEIRKLVGGISPEILLEVFTTGFRGAEV